MQLTTTHILRSMYHTFHTTESLTGMNAMVQLSHTRWLGDSKGSADYFRLMEDIFQELDLPRDQRRDLMAIHMASSHGYGMESDLTQFLRSADTDRNDYIYEYLRQSLAHEIAMLVMANPHREIEQRCTAFTQRMKHVPRSPGQRRKDW